MIRVGLRQLEARQSDFDIFAALPDKAPLSDLRIENAHKESEAIDWYGGRIQPIRQGLDQRPPRLGSRRALVQPIKNSTNFLHGCPRANVLRRSPTPDRL